MVEGYTEELQTGLVHKKNRKRKKRSVEDWNKESVPSKHYVGYEEETVEKGETVFPSVNIDAVQGFSDRDCIPKKHKKKKKKRHLKEQNSSEFHSARENQSSTVLQCCEHLERLDEGDKELPSYKHEDTDAEETYEADHDPELPFLLRKVCIHFLYIFY
jgi:hypothetical protein